MGYKQAMAMAIPSMPFGYHLWPCPTLVFEWVWDLYCAFWNDLDLMDLTCVILVHIGTCDFHFT